MGGDDRIARKARVRNAKRTAAERPLDAADEPVTTDPASDADLRAVLDQELNTLPSDLRQLVLLCDVDGLSRRVVAKRLGIPCAVSVTDATRIIPDGALIELDGDTGAVTILDAAPPETASAA